MKIQDKLDRIIDVQGKQETTLARLTVTVEDHVRRTNMLEDDIKPIKRHVAMVEGAMKLIGLLSMIAVIIETIHLVFK